MNPTAHPRPGGAGPLRSRSPRRERAVGQYFGRIDLKNQGHRTCTSRSPSSAPGRHQPHADLQAGRHRAGNGRSTCEVSAQNTRSRRPRSLAAACPEPGADRRNRRASRAERGRGHRDLRPRAGRTEIAPGRAVRLHPAGPPSGSPPARSATRRRSTTTCPSSPSTARPSTDRGRLERLRGRRRGPWRTTSLPAAGPARSRPAERRSGPFWTDLDGTGAPGMFMAELTDGIYSWIVVEWRSTCSARQPAGLPDWMGINGTEDVTFAYDPAACRRSRRPASA